MQEANRIDLLIVFCYLMGMIGIGLWASKKVKNLADFSLAGRSLGYPVMIGTLVGATIGAASTLGKAGKAYQVGIFLFIATLGYGIGLILFAFLSKRLREIGLWTIPDALRMRYGGGMEIVVAVVLILAVIALFGGQVIGIGVLFSSFGESLGLTYTSAMIVAGGIVIFYTVAGGLFAVAYTDFIQVFIMMLGVGWILPHAILTRASGVGDIWHLLAPSDGNLLGGMTVAYVVSIFLIDIPFCLVDPTLWQRANAARSGTVITRSMFVAAAIYFYWSMVCVVLGVLGAVLIPDLVQHYGSTDTIIPALTVGYLSPVVVGLCLAALMGVMMSTASVALLITGTTLSHDLIRPLRPDLSEKRLMILSRITVLVVGISGIVLALVMEGIFDLLLLSFAVYVSGVFVPTMAALYWDKATRTGAISSGMAATIVVVALYALDKPYGVEPIMVSLVVSAALMAVVSRITYRPERATPRLFR